jgi:hypothetical protein
MGARAGWRSAIPRGSGGAQRKRVLAAGEGRDLSIAQPGLAPEAKPRAQSPRARARKGCSRRRGAHAPLAHPQELGRRLARSPHALLMAAFKGLSLIRQQPCRPTAHRQCAPGCWAVSRRRRRSRWRLVLDTPAAEPPPPAPCAPPHTAPPPGVQLPCWHSHSPADQVAALPAARAVRPAATVAACNAMNSPLQAPTLPAA